MKDVYQGTTIRHKGRTVSLDQLSYIFTCPHCEYFGTTLSQEAAEVKRNTHYRTVHPEKVVDTLWEDSPLNQLTELSFK